MQNLEKQFFGRLEIRIFVDSPIQVQEVADALAKFNPVHAEPSAVFEINSIRRQDLIKDHIYSMKNENFFVADLYRSLSHAGLIRKQRGSGGSYKTLVRDIYSLSLRGVIKLRKVKKSKGGFGLLVIKNKFIVL